MSKEGKIEDDENLEQTCNYDIDVSKWLDGNVPKTRTKLDRSPNRSFYIELLLASVPYRELVRIAKDKFNEAFSIRGFSTLNNKIPEDIKNPISRMEKFAVEAPYKVNEILMMEELVREQRHRFMLAKNFEKTAQVPLSGRSQVARDLHTLLVDLQEAKMKAGVITKTPEVLEIKDGMKSVSNYTVAEKDKELERISDKIKGLERKE